MISSKWHCYCMFNLISIPNGRESVRLNDCPHLLVSYVSQRVPTCNVIGPGCHLSAALNYLAGSIFYLDLGCPGHHACLPRDTAITISLPRKSWIGSANRKINRKINRIIKCYDLY